MEIVIIAAMAENRVIGKNNVMPWSLKEDMAHFRQLTNGWPCIMGRKTWESLPQKPLLGRLNVVVSTTMTTEVQALSPMASSVPQNELCSSKRALSPKTSSVPQNELCPQRRALSLKTSSVPKEELCPQSNQTQTSSLGTELKKLAKLTQEPAENVKIFPSLLSAIKHCAGYEKIFICGGETIYRQALDMADKIELTLIHRQYEGDAFFPEIDAARWTVANTVNFDTFSFITYTKKKEQQ
ncbi:MAG: dihydrofolate reductase [Treponema sp.]|jgi:dihydrofolate reductase|nr:dihydrofolate reductase [Treponema sp.]